MLDGKADESGWMGKLLEQVRMNGALPPKKEVEPSGPRRSIDSSSWEKGTKAENMGANARWVVWWWGALGYSILMASLFFMKQETKISGIS